MSDFLTYLAWRAVQGIRAEQGDMVLVLDHAGREGLAHEIALQLDVAGATPLIDYAPPDYVANMLTHARADALQHFAKHRSQWCQQADKIIALSAGTLNLAGVPKANIEAWSRGQEILTAIEESRRLPNIVVAVPTLGMAQAINTTLAEMDAHVEAAVRATVWELQQPIERVSMADTSAQTLTLRTGDQHELHMRRAGRDWMSDDGYIDPSDIAKGAIVSNLPAGSVYTTVIEDSAEGELYLPQAGAAREVVFHFQQGRATKIEAASGANELNTHFDAHAGEPRRISHIGLGLNPYLHTRIGWTIVDEHISGALFIAFGENRYMGGQNISTLNEDYAVENATLSVDGRTVLLNGRVV